MAQLKTVSASLASLLLLALGGGLVAAGLTLKEKEEIVQWHNQQRASVSPPASNMLQLMWSEELASTAQAYSETCPQNVTRNPSRLTTPLTNTSATIGENLLIVNTSDLTNSNYTHLLQTYWADSAEVTRSNCTGDSCKEFIQVVWAESQFIGCGVGVCGDQNETTIFVCDYKPGPSDLDLMSLTAPYATGVLCSECPTHAPNCTDNGLCYLATVSVTPANSTSSRSDSAISSTPALTSNVTSPVTMATQPPTPVPFTSSGALTSSTITQHSSAITSTPAVLATQLSTNVLLTSNSSYAVYITTTRSVSMVSSSPAVPTLATNTATQLSASVLLTSNSSYTLSITTTRSVSMVSSSPAVPTLATNTATQLSATVILTSISLSTVSIATSRSDSKISSSSAVPTLATNTVISMSQISPSAVLQTVTITITKTVDSEFCPCDNEGGSGMEVCPGLDRLPSLYVILIGVIPSTLAVSLLFLLIVVVCSNRKRRRSIKLRHAQLAQHANTPRSRRRMQVRDSGIMGTPGGLTSVHHRYVSPLHSQTPPNSGDIDTPLLPSPPTPYFEEDDPVRGNTFSLVVPNSSYQESSFSSYSDTPSRTVSSVQGGPLEETVRHPMVGLTSIHEEREEDQEGVGRGGVANIIARLERGQDQGRIVTTEC